MLQFSTMFQPKTALNHIMFTLKNYYYIIWYEGVKVALWLRCWRQRRYGWGVDDNDVITPWIAPSPFIVKGGIVESLIVRKTGWNAYSDCLLLFWMLHSTNFKKINKYFFTYKYLSNYLSWNYNSVYVPLLEIAVSMWYNGGITFFNIMYNLYYTRSIQARCGVNY